MPNHAEVRDVEAIADFRTALLVYISKLRPLLDDAADEVARTREWLRVAQRVHWENKVKRIRRELADAQQALFSAELSQLRAPSTAEGAAVKNARRTLGEAEERLSRLKKTSQFFEKEALPRLKQVEQLRAMVSEEMPDAARKLERIVRSLEAYADQRTGGVTVTKEGGSA